MFYHEGYQSRDRIHRYSKRVHAQLACGVLAMRGAAAVDASLGTPAVTQFALPATEPGEPWLWGTGYS